MLLLRLTLHLNYPLCQQGQAGVEHAGRHQSGASAAPNSHYVLRCCCCCSSIAAMHNIAAAPTAALAYVTAAAIHGTAAALSPQHLLPRFTTPAPSLQLLPAALRCSDTRCYRCHRHYCCNFDTSLADATGAVELARSSLMDLPLHP
jgi:hypothetical protein